MLLVASYIFYMNWNVKYSLLLLTSTAITYLSAQVIERKPKYKKLSLITSITLNLAILFVFKYINFSIDIINNIFTNYADDTKFSYFDIILPVGISFYIFQALSYSIDVYKGKIPTEKNFFFYALYVSFFPQLVAGPIEKASHLLPELKQSKPSILTLSPSQ